MAAMATTSAPAVSPVETIGLPRPPVSSPDLTRTSALITFVRPAIPPPATIATGHLICGGMSTMTDALAITPAAIANGPARTSRT